jgi:hypothetical protein
MEYLVVPSPLVPSEVEGPSQARRSRTCLDFARHERKRPSSPVIPAKAGISLPFNAATKDEAGGKKREIPAFAGMTFDV